MCGPFAGEEFSIEAKGLFPADAILRRCTSVIAKVRSPSFFRRRFEISLAGHLTPYLDFPKIFLRTSRQ